VAGLCADRDKERGEKKVTDVYTSDILAAYEESKENY
jgi:hypothetical protein